MTPHRWTDPTLCSLCDYFRARPVYWTSPPVPGRRNRRSINAASGMLVPDLDGNSCAVDIPGGRCTCVLAQGMIWCRALVNTCCNSVRALYRIPFCAAPLITVIPSTKLLSPGRTDVVYYLPLLCRLGALFAVASWTRVMPRAAVIDDCRSTYCRCRCRGCCMVGLESGLEVGARPGKWGGSLG